MKVLGVIPARGGSTRIPRKNLETVGLYSLVELAINQANDARAHSLHFSCVSTDDAEIAKTAARRWIPDRVIARKQQGDGPMAQVLMEAVAEMAHTYECVFDAVCCLQPTSPLRTGKDIDAAVAILDANEDAASVVSVDDSTGLRNGAVYVTRVSMLRDGLVFDEHSLKYPMPHDRSIDINTPADLERAREMWAKLHG